MDNMSECIAYTCLVLDTANCSLGPPVNGVWDAGGVLRWIKHLCCVVLMVALIVEIEIIELSMRLHRRENRNIIILFLWTAK